jgi:hypothetical protein
MCVFSFSNTTYHLIDVDAEVREIFAGYLTLYSLKEPEPTSAGEFQAETGLLRYRTTQRFQPKLSLVEPPLEAADFFLVSRVRTRVCCSNSPG